MVSLGSVGNPASVEEVESNRRRHPVSQTLASTHTCIPFMCTCTYTCVCPHVCENAFSRAHHICKHTQHKDGCGEADLRCGDELGRSVFVSTYWRELVEHFYGGECLLETTSSARHHYRRPLPFLNCSSISKRWHGFLTIHRH